jgi:hypothetical protein
MYTVLFFNFCGGTLVTAATTGLLYLLRMIGDGDCVEKLVEWILAGETEVLGDKTYPSATLSTTNPTWLASGLNLGRRDGKPATNRLSYGAALSIQYYKCIYFWNIIWRFSKTLHRSLYFREKYRSRYDATAAIYVTLLSQFDLGRVLRGSVELPLASPQSSSLSPEADTIGQEWPQCQ